jgi:hypothetical protein
MMAIDDYKGAVAWLRLTLKEFQVRPDDPMMQYALLQSFEVTHNLSEAVLREIYVSLGTDEYATYLSLRELIWRANSEGIVFPCRKDWLEYGLALEKMRETLSVSAIGNRGDLVEMLSRFGDDLESFANRVQRRLVSNG